MENWHRNWLCSHNAAPCNQLCSYNDNRWLIAHNPKFLAWNKGWKGTRWYLLHIGAQQTLEDICNQNFRLYQYTFRCCGRRLACNLRCWFRIGSPRYREDKSTGSRRWDRDTIHHFGRGWVGNRRCLTRSSGPGSPSDSDRHKRLLDLCMLPRFGKALIRIRWSHADSKSQCSLPSSGNGGSYRCLRKFHCCIIILELHLEKHKFNFYYR